MSTPVYEAGRSRDTGNKLTVCLLCRGGERRVQASSVQDVHLGILDPPGRLGLSTRGLCRDQLLPQEGVRNRGCGGTTNTQPSDEDQPLWLHVKRDVHKDRPLDGCSQAMSYIIVASLIACGARPFSERLTPCCLT